MAYIVTKTINGQQYQYLVKSVREGDKVKQVYVDYIGGGSGSGGMRSASSNQIAGSKMDKRSNDAIAADTNRDAKIIFNDPDAWSKYGQDKSDLQYWDDTTVKQTTKEYKQSFADSKKDLKQDFPEYEVKGRVKKNYSIIGKLKTRNSQNKDTSLNDLTDLAGLRITTQEAKPGVNLIQKEKEIAKEVKQKYDLFDPAGEEKEENYLDKDKYGYRSYHFILEKNNKPIELQIRTPNQTRWADWGHDTLYKNKDRTIEKYGQSTYDKGKKYWDDMADYYYKKDLGTTPPYPELPKEVETNLGKLPE